MPALIIQTYLRSGCTLKDLETDYGVRARPHPNHPNLIHFCYSHVESPTYEPMLWDCRGLILDAANNWAVVAYPFRRFANHGEDWASTIDWESARVQEKLDGTLINLWFYGGQWYVSTKGSPDAGGQVGDFDFTFEELFWQTFFDQLRPWYEHLMLYNEHHSNDGRRMTLSPDRTYSFELTSPYNRVVCSYGSANKLTLIGVRENFGWFQEISTEEYADYLPVVREFPITSLEEALSVCDDLNPIKSEGFVVVDRHFNRVKLKSPKYVQLHHVRTGTGVKPLVRLVRTGEHHEFLAYFPEYKPYVSEIEAKVNAFVAKVDAGFKSVQYVEDQKEFALEVQDRFAKKYQPFLFDIRSGRMPDTWFRLVVERRFDGTLYITDEKFMSLIELSFENISLAVDANR